MKKLVVGIITFLLFINVSYALDEVKLSKCVDGDTIKVKIDNKEYTVRMLAIDTPESVHPEKKVEYYGKEASEYTCNIVSNAKKIELEYDSGSDKTDKYDRLLAWVIVDGELLQDKLVSLGYAKVAYLYGDYKYTSLLEEHQELASAKNLGIWNQQEKDKFDNNSNNTDNNDNNYSTQDIVMIVILLLVITFVGDKTIKRKAKKKLNKYLK
ncbi:MAG: thermonuclease family protein [Erysipelotrichaceae bacterium]|nr:thermonuclease family protein [Erysipelotrichaceae bacterium]